MPPTAKVSRGLRVLPAGGRKSQQSSAAELAHLRNEAAEIDQWWKTSRWQHTSRPYSALDVASLRPSPEARGNGHTSPKTTFSSAQSEKLHSLLTSLHARGGYSHTFGALDPVQAVQMAPHLSSVYVSGWQCSSTASTTNEPGPDFADYPMNTVPNKVDQLVRAQLQAGRKAGRLWLLDWIDLLDATEELLSTPSLPLGGAEQARLNTPGGGVLCER